MNQSPISRREFLKTAGASTAAFLLGACVQEKIPNQNNLTQEEIDRTLKPWRGHLGIGGEGFITQVMKDSSGRFNLVSIDNVTSASYAFAKIESENERYGFFIEETENYRSAYAFANTMVIDQGIAIRGLVSLTPDNKIEPSSKMIMFETKAGIQNVSLVDLSGDTSVTVLGFSDIEKPTAEPTEIPLDLKTKIIEVLSGATVVKAAELPTATPAIQEQPTQEPTATPQPTPTETQLPTPTPTREVKKYTEENLNGMSDEQKLIEAPEYKMSERQDVLITEDLKKHDVFEGRYIRYTSADVRPLKVYDMVEGLWHDGISVYHTGVKTPEGKEIVSKVILVNDPSLDEANARPYYIPLGEEERVARAMYQVKALNWKIKKEGLTYNQDRGKIQLMDYEQKIQFQSNAIQEFTDSISDGTVFDKVSSNRFYVDFAEINNEEQISNTKLVMGYNKNSVDFIGAGSLGWASVDNPENNIPKAKLFVKNPDTYYWNHIFEKTRPGVVFGLFGGPFGMGARSWVKDLNAVSSGPANDLTSLIIQDLCELKRSDIKDKMDPEFVTNWDRNTAIPVWGIDLPDGWVGSGIRNR